MRLHTAVLAFVLAAALPSGARAAATPAPTPSAKVLAPKPAAVTLTLAGQSPIALPNLPPPASSATTLLFALPVPAQATLAAQLELWCNTNRPFATATLWVPSVATTYTLKNVKIAKCDETTKGPSGTVAFTLTFNGVDAQK
jgi:hypothetical protein